MTFTILITTTSPYGNTSPSVVSVSFDTSSDAEMALESINKNPKIRIEQSDLTRFAEPLNFVVY